MKELLLYLTQSEETDKTTLFKNLNEKDINEALSSIGHSVCTQEIKTINESGFNDVLHFIYIRRKKFSTQTLANTISSTSQLVNASQLKTLNYEELHQMLDLLSKKSKQTSAADLTITLDAIATLLKKSKIKFLNVKQDIKNLFNAFHEMNDTATPAELTTVMRTAVRITDTDENTKNLFDAQFISNIFARFSSTSEYATLDELANNVRYIFVFSRNTDILIDNNKINHLLDQFIIKLMRNKSQNRNVCEAIGIMLTSIADLFSTNTLKSINAKQFEYLFIQFYLHQHLLKPQYISNVLSATSILLQANIPLKINSIQFKILYDRLSVQSKNVLNHKAHSDFLSAEKILKALNQTNAGEEKQDGDSQPKYVEIQIPRAQLSKELKTVGRKIHELTHRKVYVVGSSAPNAALARENEQNTDGDLRICDYDLNLLFQQISRWNEARNVKFIKGDHPIIRFNAFNRPFEIATVQKANDETESAAIMNTLYGLNLERLVLTLAATTVGTDENETYETLFGTEFAVKTFLQKRISLDNPSYFINNPNTALRLCKKIRDYPDFTVDQNILDLLSSPNLATSFRDAFCDENNGSKMIGRFCTTLEAAITSHSPVSILEIMGATGIYHAATGLDYDEVKTSIYRSLMQLAHCEGSYFKRLGINAFTLSAFCQKYSTSSIHESNQLLHKWSFHKVAINTLPEDQHLLNLIINKALFNNSIELDKSSLTQKQKNLYTMIIDNNIEKPTSNKTLNTQSKARLFSVPDEKQPHNNNHTVNVHVKKTEPTARKMPPQNGTLKLTG